jgi:hypothetical protein
MNPMKHVKTLATAAALVLPVASVASVAAQTWTQDIVVSGLSAPAAVAVDKSDNVYVTTQNGDVLKETLSLGNYTQSVVANYTSISEGGPRVLGIAVDASGNLFIAANTPSSLDGLFENNGGVFEQQPLTGGGYSDPTFLFGYGDNYDVNFVALDPSDDIYFTGAGYGSYFGLPPSGYDFVVAERFLLRSFSGGTDGYGADLHPEDHVFGDVGRVVGRRAPGCGRSSAHSAPAEPGGSLLPSPWSATL